MLETQCLFISTTWREDWLIDLYIHVGGNHPFFTTVKKKIKNFVGFEKNCCIFIRLHIMELKIHDAYQVVSISFLVNC